MRAASVQGELWSAAVARSLESYKQGNGSYVRRNDFRYFITTA